MCLLGKLLPDNDIYLPCLVFKRHKGDATGRTGPLLRNDQTRYVDLLAIADTTVAVFERFRTFVLICQSV